MSYENACEFVEKMKQNQDFRKMAGCSPSKEKFEEFIKENGFSFEENHLASAMASCMNEIDEMMKK